MKSDAELSAYQRKLESIDNVILCVAEAERMIAEIGKSLVDDIEQYKDYVLKKRRRRSCGWKVHNYCR
jgi:hypothetical protein